MLHGTVLVVVVYDVNTPLDFAKKAAVSLASRRVAPEPRPQEIPFTEKCFSGAVPMSGAQYTNRGGSIPKF